MEIGNNFSDKAKRDYELVMSAIDGDQKAYAELLGTYRDSIYFMLLKMVSNKSDAEDLTIEAFGKAFKNLKNYTPNYAFSTWLFKIATNNCIDFLRKKKIQQKHVSIDKENEEDYQSTVTLFSTAPDPEEELIIKQKEKLLHTIVKKLNPRYRDLVKLRYFEQMSYAEIAEELNLPIGTVKAQLYRSRELLANTLKNSEDQI